MKNIDARDKIINETKYIIDDYFTILVPLTYDSMKYWARYTRWDTPSPYSYGKSRDEHHYVVILPNGGKILCKTATRYFPFEARNASDNEVDCYFIKENWKYFKYLIDILPLSHIPDHILTQKICDDHVVENGLEIKNVPKKFITYDLYKKAVYNNGHALEFIPLEATTHELYIIAVKNNPHAIAHIPKSSLTYDICNIAVKKSGATFRHIPEKFITPEMCEIAVKNWGWAIKHVPEKYLTKELSEYAFRNKISIKSQSLLY